MQASINNGTTQCMQASINNGTTQCMQASINNGNSIILLVKDLPKNIFNYDAN